MFCYTLLTKGLNSSFVLSPKQYIDNIFLIRRHSRGELDPFIRCLTVKGISDISNTLTGLQSVTKDSLVRLQILIKPTDSHLPTLQLIPTKTAEAPIQPCSPISQNLQHNISFTTKQHLHWKTTYKLEDIQKRLVDIAIS